VFKVGDKVKILKSPYEGTVQIISTIEEPPGDNHGEWFRMEGLDNTGEYWTKDELASPINPLDRGTIFKPFSHSHCTVSNNEPTAFTSEPSEYGFTVEEESLRDDAANNLKSSWLVNAGNLHAVVAKFIITHPELF